MPNEMTQLSETEIATVASLLSRLEPGYLPQALFNEFTRLSVTATIVLVLLRQTANGPEILLVQREAYDPVWPSYWHLPGSMLRPNDCEGDYRDAFKRIISGELNGTALTAKPKLVRTAFTQTRRGREITRVYCSTIQGEPKEGDFFSVSKLPKNMIEHEPAYVRLAIKKSKA